MAAGGRGTLVVALETHSTHEVTYKHLGRWCHVLVRRVRVRVGTIAVGRKDGSRVVAILSRIQIEEAESAKEARGAEHQ